MRCVNFSDVLLRLSEGNWDATFIICRLADAPMREHANTMGQHIPGASIGLRMDFALSSSQIGRKLKLVVPIRQPHLASRSESAHDGDAERFLFHSCIRGGCQLSGHVRVRKSLRRN
jgi:hypothetical protein